MREDRLELISKCDTINDLFEIWMKEQKNESDVDWEITKGQTKNIEKGTFCIDGIINTDRFQKQNKKVLFITNVLFSSETSTALSVLIKNSHLLLSSLLSSTVSGIFCIFL